MKIIIGLLMLLITVASQAQTINGKVCYGKDKSPVQFASVALLQLPDSSMITGGITLTDGAYSLDRIKPGNYYLRASFVGFRNGGKQVTVSEGQKEITLDTIYLNEISTELGEVTVVGERLKGKEMVDRTSYAIPEVISKTASNGYDILKKIPQVNVDFQNNITLNGSSNFIIQVDGRQRDREFLARLLPSDIQSIEIVNNPSGKYEGNIDGVINIILKKEARYGINGNVAGSLKPFNRVTSAVTGSIDYSVGKVTFYTTAFSFVQNLNINSRNESRFTSLDSLTSMTGKGDINVGQSSVNSGFDYYVNDKNNISFNVSYKPSFQNVELPNSTILYKSLVPLNSILSSVDEKSRSNETAFSLFYKKTFDKQIEEFTAEANYYMFRSDENNIFSNMRYLYNSNDVLDNYSRIEDNLNRRNYFMTKLDYVYPLGMYAKLETGYQFYYQQMAYDFNIDLGEDNNLFEYNEFRNSAYGGVTLNLKKFGFQTMLRVENSHIDADSVSKPDYTCLLPSANLQYKFSASHNLKFTYNRRINRPGIYNMNPYWRIGSDYAITQGNPDLRPDYRDRLQLTYTWNFGSNYFSPYIYDEFFSDKTGNRYSLVQSPVTGSWTTLSKPYNLLTGYEMGGGVNAMLWYVNINARVFKGHFDGYSETGFSIPPRDYFSYSVTGYAYGNLDKKKKITGFLYMNYNGVNINAQSKTYSLPLYGLGGQYQLKSHSFGVFWLLPFSHTVNFQRTETETPVYNSTSSTGIDIANFIQFQYSYKFNKGKNVKKLDRKVQVESDSKSQAIGR